MNDTQWYEYDEDGDVLDVYFVPERRPAWTVELTPNIMISIDRSLREAVSLTFMDYSALTESALHGRRSFAVTGLADMPIEERELVLTILDRPHIQEWVVISVVENLPDSPFTVIHLQSPPRELLPLLPVETA